MIILPFAHDKEILHFPYVTMAIIAICFGVQIFTSLSGSSENEIAQNQARELMVRKKIWRKHGRRWYSEHFGQHRKPPQSPREVRALMRKIKSARIHFFEDFEAGRIVASTDPDFLELKNIKRDQQKKQHTLAFAYHPRRALYTLFTYAFIHGGWFHLIGNMIFLFLCGCNLEDRWGRGIWLMVYLLGGAFSAMTWGMLHRQSPYPLVGASGAIAAAMAAFFVIFIKAKIRFFYLLWFFSKPIKGTFEMHAYWAIPFWVLEQLMGLLFEDSARVAYSAHVGGFAFGLGVALVIKGSGLDRRLHSTSLAKATLYSEHPLYLEGLQHLERNDVPAASAAFEKLLIEKPEHLSATLELFRMQTDALSAARLANKIVGLAKRQGDAELPLLVYAEMIQRFPQTSLTDRSLFTIADEYEKRSDHSSARAVYERFLQDHPQSALAPKVMLNLAHLFTDTFHQPEKAIPWLETVISQFPNTAFAERAESLLPPQDQSLHD